MNNIKYALALIFACFSMSVFAQDEPEKAEPKKFAVYVSGASEAGINRSFGNKLLAAITKSGKYAEIGNSETFYKELAKNNETDISQITQTAKQHGADFLCVVSMAEAFGEYSISARIVRTADSKAIRTASLDRSMKSLDDLTRVSDELASQLFQLQTRASSPSATPAPAAVAPAVKRECKKKININEIVFVIQNGFPAQLKDCSSALAKDMALASSPFGKKTEQKEPKAFMKQCVIDGIRQELPSGADEYLKSVESFLQNILNAASAAGGGLDVKKLSGAIGGMSIGDLLNGIRRLAGEDVCMVDEPYEPPAASRSKEKRSNKKDESILSLGFRTGFNFSHLSANYDNGYRSIEGSYNSTAGFQFGLVLDIAASEVFHIQPGLMYIQKGTEDKMGDALTFHYIEAPLLLSLKFSAFRLNAGPYFGLCVGGVCDFFDFGVSTGLGFDIGMFYIGVFYDYGFFDSYYNSYGYVSGSRGVIAGNRTLGFNFGVNL
jgi:hypothetical protein